MIYKLGYGYLCLRYIDLSFNNMHLKYVAIC